MYIRLHTNTHTHTHTHKHTNSQNTYAHTNIHTSLNLHRFVVDLERREHEVAKLKMSSMLHEVEPLQGRGLRLFTVYMFMCVCI
jgi:hypothetical protein